MPHLPPWAESAIATHLPPGNPVLNGRALSSRLALANTPLGAVLLQRPLVGGVKVTFLEIPADRVAFDCGGCGESLQFLNPELPRTVFCSICAQAYRLGAEGQVEPVEAEPHASPSAPAPAPDEVGLVTMEEPAPVEAAALGPAAAYDGPGQPIRVLEGPAAHADALEAQGIADTAALRRAPPHALAQALGVDAGTAAQWQAAAELLLVRGIGPQAAETLAAAGIRGIDELRRRTGAAIARQVASSQGGRAPSPARIEAWRSAAKTLRKVPAAPLAAT